MPSPVPAALDSQTLVLLPRATLAGGHLPGTVLTVGDEYDLRFMLDRLAAFPPGGPRPSEEFAYPAIRSVEVMGATRNSRFGAETTALATLGVAGELVTLTGSRLKTILRMETPAGELFFVTSGVAPEDLRIVLSAALAAIREAQPRDVVDDLSRLARLFDDGLLTRDEFEQLKTGLLQ
jgi:hypothetical protein